MACFFHGSVILAGCLFMIISMNGNSVVTSALIPAVIQTWPWPEAAQKAWETLDAGGGSAVDAVVDGCSVCEEIGSCSVSVGMGGRPDEQGETTLDAMVMDGVTHRVGSVGCLRGVKSAIAVARAVMLYTKSTLLVGELAAQFAIEMGFQQMNLSTNSSIADFEAWKANDCQPNSRINVRPDPTTSCGPYTPNDETVSPEHHRTRRNGDSDSKWPPLVTEHEHDTIGMVALDAKGNIASGTSTNGLGRKVPGRVGDSPITGAGSYVDKDVGGAAATGNGDVMMRYLPTYQAVESMRAGKTPMQAAREAINRISKVERHWSGSLIVMNMKGEQGAACSSISTNFTFRYCYRNPNSQKVDIFEVECNIDDTNSAANHITGIFSLNLSFFSLLLACIVYL